MGGHISSYASMATLYEVAYNHFFRGGDGKRPADLIYFQGHTTPGNYARAFLEYRLEERHLHNFRRELAEGGGLSSYPHPYLMPDFWQFPTVSMGLGPIMSIYQARFVRYLKARGLLKTEEEPRVWAFVGDGESDEPETLGALTLAAREGLDNLTWVVNCNLQRLDGPVRGNGKIIQELEGVFRGAGWNVIKVDLGFAVGRTVRAGTNRACCIKRMDEAVDGDFQKYTVAPGSYIRRHFFGKYPELLQLVDHLTDEDLTRLVRGGHDPVKVYAAYKAAVEHKGGPTAILAKTVKGYGLGEAGEGRNISHQQKKMNEKELREFRARFDVPISDEDIADTPFFRPAKDFPGNEVFAGTPQEAGRICPQTRGQGRAAADAAPGGVPGIAQRLRRGGGFHHQEFCPPPERAGAGPGKWAGGSCRLFPTRRALSALIRSSARSAFTPPRDSFTSRWTRTPASAFTTKPRTGRFWRKASPKPARWRRLSRRERPTPTTASI